MPTRTAMAVLFAIMALSTACGGDGGNNPSTGSDDAPRRIDVAMVDIDFEPETLEVAKGEEVRFRFINEGKVRHEAYFGDASEQAEHEKKMVEEGDDAGGHDEHGGGGGSNRKIAVDAGESADITYRFDQVGTFEIGCHEPGHYAGGMKITVTVT